MRHELMKRLPPKVVFSRSILFDPQDWPCTKGVEKHRAPWLDQRIPPRRVAHGAWAESPGHEGQHYP